MEKEDKKEQTPKEAANVGQYLQFTRQSQKKSIETVAKALCIRKIYIKAIEENDFNELPPVPYGIGFVRSYAAYLGLNVDRVVQCYKEEAMPEKVLGGKPVVKKHTETTKPNKFQILLALIGLALLYAGWFIYTLKDSPDIEPDEVIEQIEIIEPEELIPETDDAVVEVDAQPTESDLSEVEEIISEEPEVSVPVEEKNTSGMVVKFNGESWIEIRDAEKIYITGIYQKGFEYEVPNKSGLIFSVGKQQNVDVFLDGELIKITRPQKQTKISLDEYLNH